MKNFFLKEARAKIWNKLTNPIKHSKAAPRYFARASFFGLLIGLTPTVGIQIPFLIVFWGVVRRFLPKYDFSIMLATAWTLLTSAATLPFFYYLFIITGRFMLGGNGEVSVFSEIQKKFEVMSSQEFSILERFYAYSLSLLEYFGLPLFVGCVPWAIAGATLGYLWTFWLVKKVRETN